MGTWGERAFENDTANDWAYDLEDVDDLSLVESALEELEEAEDDDVDQDLACEALAACDVLARLLGKPGYKDGFTENVDNWVASHKIKPPVSLLKRATAAIDRILGEDSELRQVWEKSDDGGKKWRAAVQDLRRRLKK
jgi:hypothetical protein